ncbi:MULTISPECIES: hypothetical protein [Xanthomonas translucens group]|uniref:hypothetical protein n=1 Tax=Xanthomonas translucens group TaxID=3390202 RepID=UPI0019D6B58D|nr:hypothetical protein [Xanthomonas translucens]QSQ62244.1 hypothetical protein ISN38_19955 [Xanthomonas translucens pv. undulosa]WIH07070.1 hypothetical protein KHF85_20000 [Xanthomonas translucens pv. graminis]
MAKKTYDPYRPSSEPAMSIYDAFQDEAAKRKGRDVAEWIKAERDAVYRAAMLAFERAGLPAPTMDEVELAERYARGSSDYGSKWSYTIISCVRNRMRSQASSVTAREIE